MTFKQSVSTCFNKYITISGRASRSEYWWFQLFLFIGGFITAFLDSLVAGDISTSGALNSTFTLITFIPGITVTTRRLHDINKSGWWQLWMGLILLGVIALAAILFTATDTLTGSNIATSGIMLLTTGGIIATALVRLYWLTKKSDPEVNRFGPPPWENVDNS